MTHCTQPQFSAVDIRSAGAGKKPVLTARPGAPVIPAEKQVFGSANKVRQLTNLHRSVMQTLEHAKPGTELFSRIDTFAKSVLLAAELAEIINVPAVGTSSASSSATAATAELSSLHDLGELAHAALAAGRESQGIAVLSGIGFLLGGAPRAALERALGLLRVKRNSQACNELAKALDGMADQDGMATALLAQLWFDARDPRWVPLAKRVLATALNVEARARCTELLSGTNQPLHG